MGILLFVAGVVVTMLNLFRRPNVVFLTWATLYSISVVWLTYDRDFAIGLSVGSYNLFFNDVILLFFLWALARNWKVVYLKFQNLFLFKILLIALGLNMIVFIVELFFGNYGLQGLYNFSRGFIDIPVAFLYYLSFNYTEKGVSDCFRKLNYLTLVISLFFWIATVLVFSGKLNIGQDDRVVNAYVAFFVPVSCLFLLVRYLSFKATRAEMILLIFFILTIVFMRQRSLWIGFSGGLITVLYYYRQRLSRVFSVVAIGVVVLFVLSFFFQSVSSRLLDRFSTATQDLTEMRSFEKSTGAFRVARWVSRIESNFDYRVIFFGQGHGYKRTSLIEFQGREGENSTSFHNQYLEQAFRIGLISVVLLLIGVFGVMRLNNRYLSKDIAVVFNAIYVFTLIFGMAYNFQLIFYIMLAVNLSYIYIKYQHHLRQSPVETKRLQLYTRTENVN